MFPSVSLMRGVYVHLSSTWTKKAFFPMPCCLILLSFLSFTHSLLCSSDLFLLLDDTFFFLIMISFTCSFFTTSSNVSNSLFLSFFLHFPSLFPSIWLLGHCLLPPVLLVSSDAPTPAAIPQCIAALQNRASVKTERLLTS